MVGTEYIFVEWRDISVSELMFLNVFFPCCWNAEPGFRGLTPPIPWEHAPRPHFPLVPASWPYGLHQNFMHQGNARFQPNKPFYTQGTMAYKLVNRLGWVSGIESLSEGQDLGVKIHEFSKHLLRDHTVCQIVLGACCSSKSKTKSPLLDAHFIRKARHVK